MAAPKYIRPGQGDIFSGVFTEGIGTIGGMSPKIGGGGSPGGGGSTTKGNLSKLWNRLMNAISGTKSKDFGNPTMWHNTGKNIIPNQIKSIKDPNIKKQLNDTYWNYLRLDGAILGKAEVSLKSWKPTVQEVTKIPKVDPYKKFNLKTKKQSSGKNTQTVVDPNVTLGKDASLNERLFYNPRARKYFIDKTGSVLHRTHASKGPYRTEQIVKNPKLKEKLDQPTGLNTQVRNSLQNKLEDNVINLEKQKLSIINNKNLKKINLNKWKKRIKKIDDKIALVKKDIKNLGLDVQLISPSSGRLTHYGSNFPSLKKLADSISKDIKLKTISYGGSNILPAGKKEGGIVGISQLTRTL